MKLSDRSKNWVLVFLLSLLLLFIGTPVAIDLQYQRLVQSAVQEPSLLYGYAAPLVQPPGVVQISEYNSFIGHQNTVEVYNSTDQPVDAVLDIIHSDGSHLFSLNVSLPPRGARRIPLENVEVDSYGTIVIHGDGVVFRNYINSKEEYVLTFLGK